MLKQPRFLNHVKDKVYYFNKVAIISFNLLRYQQECTILRGSRHICGPPSTYQTFNPTLKNHQRLFETDFDKFRSFNMASPRANASSTSKDEKGSASNDAVKSRLSKEELRARLSQIQYQVTQLKGTERPGTGEYYKFNKKGSYHCVVCDLELFKSDSKFESGCGWPAFSEAADKNRVKYVQDHSLVSASNLLLLAKKADLIRTEVLCANCDAHLGHRFDDGPLSKGGKRYCINSASLKFVSGQDSS